MGHSINIPIDLSDDGVRSLRFLIGNPIAKVLLVAWIVVPIIQTLDRRWGKPP